MNPGNRVILPAGPMTLLMKYVSASALLILAVLMFRQRLKPVIIIAIEHVPRQKPLFWVEEVDGATNKPKVKSMSLKTWQTHYDAHKLGAVIDPSKLSDALATVTAAIKERDSRRNQLSNADDDRPAAETRAPGSSNARTLRSNTGRSSGLHTGSGSRDQGEIKKRKKKTKPTTQVWSCS
jgi:hypothetical protein